MGKGGDLVSILGNGHGLRLGLDLSSPPGDPGLLGNVRDLSPPSVRGLYLLGLAVSIAFGYPRRPLAFTP